ERVRPGGGRRAVDLDGVRAQNARRAARSAGNPANGDRGTHVERERRTQNGERRTVLADCLFCKIVKREIPASIVYEDDRVLAFNDINAQGPTHVLVIPKRHIATLNELSDTDDALVGELVRRAAAIAKERGLS